VSVTITPVSGFPEVTTGTDLVPLLAEHLTSAALTDGDVVVVTQKIVSKAEGRLVPAERRERRSPPRPPRSSHAVTTSRSSGRVTGSSARTPGSTRRTSPAGRSPCCLKIPTEAPNVCAPGSRRPSVSRSRS
jgi:hypothetical protein